MPVVAPAAGGPLEGHGVNGFLWSPEAPETRRGAVLELADEQKRRRPGNAAQRSVVGRSWPAGLDRAIDHYRIATGANPLVATA